MKLRLVDIAIALAFFVWLAVSFLLMSSEGG